jgi:hypothetical protein
MDKRDNSGGPWRNTVSEDAQIFNKKFNRNEHLIKPLNRKKRYKFHMSCDMTCNAVGVQTWRIGRQSDGHVDATVNCKLQMAS